MNKKNYSKIIVGVIIISVFSLITVLILILSDNNKIDVSTVSNNASPQNEIFNKSDYSILENKQIIFNVEFAVNSFNYELFFDSNNCYDMLNKNYIFERKITKDNLKSILNPNRYEKTFYYKKGYQLKKGNLTYYFVEGYELNYSMANSSTVINNNSKYLLVISNGRFVINPILNNSEITTYIENYHYSEEQSDLKKKLEQYTSSDFNDVNYYYSRFLKILYNDPQEAFTLLDKNMFSSYEAFLDNLNELKESLSGQIFAFSKEEKNGSNVFKIIDQNQNIIVLTENKPMNFIIFIEIR